MDNPGATQSQIELEKYSKPRHQETFNQIYRHAAKMREKASVYDPNEQADMCLYRPEGKLPCFIGALIPDELYDPRMDNPKTRGMSVVDIFREFPAVEKSFHERGLISNPYKMTTLQSIHDMHFIDRMDQLRRYAVEYNLTIPAHVLEVTQV